MINWKTILNGNNEHFGFVIQGFLSSFISRVNRTKDLLAPLHRLNSIVLYFNLCDILKMKKKKRLWLFLLWYRSLLTPDEKEFLSILRYITSGWQQTSLGNTESNWFLHYLSGERTRWRIDPSSRTPFHIFQMPLARLHWAHGCVSALHLL